MAEAEIREGIRLEPDNAGFLWNLGSIQQLRGDHADALNTFSIANLIYADASMHDQRTPEDELGRSERLYSHEKHLAAILLGQQAPLEPDQKIDVAEVCRHKRLFADAARFYREAFEARAALAEDLASGNRRNAAIAAAQVGTDSRVGTDIQPLDPAAKADHRAQALGWLRADRDASVRILSEKDSEQHPVARRTLDIMLHHRDLACVRSPEALAKLPEAERVEWQKFWAEVSALMDDSK